MKQIKLYFYLLALLLGVGIQNAQAQAEVTPYRFEFSAIWSNTPISGTVTYNTVGTGWGRYWEEGSGTTGRVAYLRNTGTANNHTTTGAIASSVQVSQTSNTRHDMLVTPLVKGNISLWAKKYGTSAAYTGYIKLYAMEFNEDEDGVYYTMKSSTPIAETTLSTTTYTEITASVDDYTYIGIEAQYCYFDDFYAESAKVDLQDKLVISNLTNANSPTNYDDADENGNVPIKFYFYVRNDGDRDATGDMKVRVYSANGFDKTVEMGEQTVKIGEVKTFGTNASPAVNITFPYADYPDPADYYAIATINGVSTDPFRLFNRQISPNPYGAIPTPKLYTNNNVLLPDGATLKFQPSKVARTVQISMQNTGTIPLTFSDIEVPEGFTTNLSTSTTVAKHLTSNFTISSSDITPGHHEGDFKFKTNGGDFTWHLSYEIADGYCENFETTSNPAYLVREGNAEWSSSSWARYENVDDNQYSFQHPSTKTGKLILPLLDVKDGDVFSFSAARLNKQIQTVDGEKVYPVTTVSKVDVWYSTDRANWTLLKTIGNDQLPTESTEYNNSLYYHFGTYTIDELSAGNYYLAFSGDSIFIDNMYGKVGYAEIEQSHNLAVTSFSIPEDGAVNSVYKASATLYNGSATVEPATYTAKLYFGDEVVGEAQPVELAASVYNPMTAPRISFSLTPHKAGTYPAHIEFETTDGYVAKSATVNVTIAPESGTLDQPVGNANSSIYPLDNNIVTLEMVYPAEKIALPVGTEIKSITFKGYVGVGSMGNSTTTSYDFKMFVASTEDGAYVAPYSLANTESMTKVMEKSISFDFGTGAGGYDNQLGRTIVTDAADLIRANLTTPIIYDGKNLRIVLYGERSSVGVVPYIESDKDCTDYTIYKKAYDTNYYNTATISTTELPVVYLGVDVDATHVTGTVTDEAGTPVEGVSIELQSNDDDVNYKATTNTEGKYDIEMYQTQRNFHLRVEKAGYYPQDYDFDVTESLVKDIQLVEATGLNIESTNLPDGEVNTTYTATANVSNFTAATISPSDYTATLYVNGEAVATAEGLEVESAGNATLSFSYTPHAAGTFPAYVEIVHTNGTIANTDAEDITIAEEVRNTVHQVGTPSSPSVNTGYVFTNTNYIHGLVELYYTEAELQAADIQVGDIIRGVTVKGWSTVANPTQFAAKVYMQKTDKTAPTWTNFSTFTLNDVNEMTNVYDGTITVEAKGSSNELADFYVLPFSEGFVYEGGNLTFTVATDALNNSTANAWFLYDKNGNNNGLYAYYNNNNTSTTYDRAYKTSRAVLFLDVDRFRTVDGTVTKAGTSDVIENVSVTVKSGDVEYYGTTDAEGKYEINVGKFDLDYTATFEHDDYAPAEKPVSFSEGNVTVNAELAPAYKLTGKVTRVADGEPIEGATITVSNDDNEYSATSDAEGNYLVKVLNNDNAYTAKYEAEGYETVEFEDIAFDGNLTKDVALRTETTVSGTVTREGKDTPVAEATITFTQGDDTYTATSAEDGTYSVVLYNLEQNFTVKAEATGYETLDTEYNPESGSTFNISLKAYRTLNGKVTEKGTETAIPGVSVTLANDDASYTATTDDNGEYSITVYEFDNELTATFEAEGYETATETVTFTDLTQTLNVELTAFRTLTGKVTEKGSGNPVADVSITLTNGETEYTATTDEEGEYTITVYDFASELTATFEAEGYESATETVTFTELTQTLNVELTAYRTLSGKVTIGGTDTPLSGVTVTLTGDSGEQTATTADDGTYSFTLYDFAGTFTATFELEGYESVTEVVTFNNVNEVLDVELSEIIDGISRISIDGVASGKVYTINGQLVGTDVNLKELPRGVYVINGRKINIK